MWVMVNVSTLLKCYEIYATTEISVISVKTEKFSVHLKIITHSTNREWVNLCMVELMTPNQTNDPGITFEWNGYQKIWIQFWIPLPLPEIYIFWIFDILNILHSYFEKTVKFGCFCMGKYLIEFLITQTMYPNSG